ncbi:acyl-CoA dehydrogenase domain protein [Mycobacterium xenopi 3993]|nr:acyl-CoA dehydrogenase domain protein [Mycobacterium xenopi 3993]
MATDAAEDAQNHAALRCRIRAFLESAPKPTGLRNYGPTPAETDVEPAGPGTNT